MKKDTAFFDLFCIMLVVLLGVLAIAEVYVIGAMVRDAWLRSNQPALDVHVHAERVPPPERALPSQELALQSWQLMRDAASYGYERGTNGDSWPSTENALRQAWERVMSGQEANLKTAK